MFELPVFTEIGLIFKKDLCYNVSVLTKLLMNHYHYHNYSDSNYERCVRAQH